MTAENSAGTAPVSPPAPARADSDAGLPLDEMEVVALLLAVPALAKFASVDAAIQRIRHPGLAHVARELVAAVRDSRRVNADRVAARALQGAPRPVRLAVCEASLALGEVESPHAALAAAVEALGACSCCGGRSPVALVTTTGRRCGRCVRRAGNRRVLPRREVSP